MATAVAILDHRGPAARVLDAADALAEGRAILIYDEFRPEVGAALVAAAALVTAESLADLLGSSSGLISVALPDSDADRLGLVLQSDDIAGARAYTVTVDLASGTTTGISSYDRAVTIRALADPGTQPNDLLRPGHVMPVRTRPLGVLERARPSEAAVDLCRITGLAPAAMICDVLDGSGAVPTPDYLFGMAAVHGQLAISSQEVLRHRVLNEDLGRVVDRRSVAHADVNVVIATVASPLSDADIIVMAGAFADGLVLRLHEGCGNGELGFATCGCQDALIGSLDEVARRESVIVRVPATGRPCRSQPAPRIGHAEEVVVALRAVGITNVRETPSAQTRTLNDLLTDAGRPR